MSEDLETIAMHAELIVSGFAFSREKDLVRVINLNCPDDALVIDKNERVIETTMDDIAIAIVMEIYDHNKQYLS